MSNAVRLTSAALLVAALGACAGGTNSASSGSTTTAMTSSSSEATTPSTTNATTAAPTSPSSSTTTRVMDPASACARSTFDGLTKSERVGQLLMVGLDTNAPASSLDDEFAAAHVGNAILLGGWEGKDKVIAATDHLAAKRTKGIGVLLAADQEGGEVHQLRGDYPELPDALTQGQWSAAELTSRATTLAKAIKASGINLNLAPVADTVPADIGRANEPIGKWGRQFSADPALNGRMSVAFIKGMHTGGVLTTAKHFPGLGRIRSNTDFNSTGITDSVTTANDPYLQPFSASIKGGVDLVMVGSAIYSKIDPGVNAMFSKRIVTGMLREQLGWNGVVITDDVGFAKAVRSLTNKQRAVRFVQAGGDIVLTADPLDIRPMHEALLTTAGSDPAFAQLVDTSVMRVLVLKARNGLLSCG